MTVHSDHKPLETIFKRPLASAPHRQQSMMLSLQRYTFHVEYPKGSSLYLTDALSCAPLPTKSHKQVHGELVYQVEFESNNPDLSAFHDATLQDIRTAAGTDPKQIILCFLSSTGWPNDMAAVPEMARPYWSVRHELIVHDGLPFKHDCIIIPSSLRERLLFKLHAALCGSKFTLCYACSCVFWAGLALTAKSQTCVNLGSFVLDMHTNIPASHSNPIQYLPYYGNWCSRTWSNLMV